MPALNFKARYVDAVIAGTKPHTIRKWRKRPFIEGDTLSFFSGPRMKPRRIRPNTPCAAATPIEVNAHHRYVILSEGSLLYSAGRLPDAEVEKLAKADGFASAEDFFSFFQEVHGGLVCGQLIEWNPRIAVSDVFKPGAHREETALGAAAVDAAATDRAHDAPAK